MAPAGLVSAASGVWMAVAYDLPDTSGVTLMVMRIILGSVMAGGIVFAVTARGDALIDPNVTVRLIAAFADAEPAPRPSSGPALTEREAQVADAVARGLGNVEIGRELHISLSTVKTHIASVMAKIGARNRVEVAMWAARR